MVSRKNSRNVEDESMCKPNSLEVYYYKGLLEYEAENYSVVIEDLNRAIELNPNHESAYFKRGMAKEKTGDKKGCCNDLKTAADKGNLGAYHYQKKFCS